MAGDDDAKRAILVRRARFVAAALAGVGIAASCKTTQPDQPPEVCLSPPQQLLPDAEGPVEEEADAGPPPQPCLSPPPEACLSQPAPEDEPGPFAEPPPDES